MTRIVYAKRDMRSKDGIIWYNSKVFGLIPKHFVTHLVYKKLSKKEKPKWKRMQIQSFFEKQKYGKPVDEINDFKKKEDENDKQ